MPDKNEICLEEEKIRLQVRELPEQKRLQFYTLLEKNVKDPDSYAVLNYLFITGLHHFYLGKWLRGSMNLMLFLLALYLIFNGIVVPGLVLILITSLFELYALFNAEVIVQQYNNHLMKALLKEIDKQV